MCYKMHILNCRGAIANVMVLSYEGDFHEVFSGKICLLLYLFSVLISIECQKSNI